MALNPKDITPSEIRVLMQFDSADLPNDVDMNKIIEFAGYRLAAEVGTQTDDMYKYTQYLLVKAHILTSLASKALSKGYIMAEAQGRRVKKAYEELRAEAEKIMEEYHTVINNLYRTEVTMTMPISDAVSSEISEEYAKIMQGINNAEDMESTQYYTPSRSGD